VCVCRVVICASSNSSSSSTFDNFNNNNNQWGLTFITPFFFLKNNIVDFKETEMFFVQNHCITDMLLNIGHSKRSSLLVFLFLSRMAQVSILLLLSELAIVVLLSQLFLFFNLHMRVLNKQWLAFIGLQTVLTNT
jgi:hypothetical protein